MGYRSRDISGKTEGAAVAFGLLGMADAIRSWTWAGVLP